MPVAESAQMCALLAGTEKMVRIVGRSSVIELSYTADSTPSDALQSLQAALVQHFVACLDFLAEATRLFSQGLATRTLHAILHPDQAGGCVSALARSELELGYAVQACEARRSAAADAGARDKMDALEDLMRGLDVPLARFDQAVSTLLESVDQREHIDILQQISAIP